MHAADRVLGWPLRSRHLLAGGRMHARVGAATNVLRNHFSVQGALSKYLDTHLRLLLLY